MNNILLIPLINNTLFTRIIENTSIFINRNTTRSQTKTSHGCLHTQFIYVCLCLLDDINLIQIMNLQKNKNFIDDTINNISLKISKIYQNILEYSRNIIPMINNSTFKYLISPISNVNNLYYYEDKVYSKDNSKIIPMCIYINSDSDDQLYNIIHYFTLLIVDNIIYINSSYGSDDICIPNITLEIDINYLNTVLDLFYQETYDSTYKKNNLENFIKTYFLPGIDDRIANKEIDNIIKGKIGIMLNYFTTVNNAIQELQLIGGKYKIKTQKYKIKKYKTRKSKIQKYKTRKYKIKKYKMKKNKTKNNKRKK